MGNKNVRHKSPVALVLVDVVNHFEFLEGDKILKNALPIAPRLARLKKMARESKVPVIYVNDNFGRWRSDFRRQVEHCLKKNSRAAEMVMALRPEESDYFVLKPKHSGFFATTLETLLRYLGARRLILTGIAGNFCVLFTANDAYMRDYEIIVPPDCVISNTVKENRQALQLMRKFLSADLRPSARVAFPRARTNSRAKRRAAA